MGGVEGGCALCSPRVGNGISFRKKFRGIDSERFPLFCRRKSTLSYISSTLGFISSTALGFISYTLGYVSSTLGFISYYTHGYISSAHGYISSTFGYISSTLGYISSTLGFISSTLGFISYTLGFISSTHGNISSTLGYISSTLGYISSISYGLFKNSQFEYCQRLMLPRFVPSCLLFRRMVRNGIPRVCFYFSSKERNSKLFSLPLKGSEGNSESMRLFFVHGTEF